jgi:hypothetical protein
MSFSVPAANAPRAASRLRFVLVQAVLWMVLSVILRVILTHSFAWHLPMNFGETLRFHAHGLLADTMIATWIFLPMALWITVMPERWVAARWHRAVLLAYAWLWWALALFLFIAEYYFFDEYNSRFNTVAIDYLHYWTEVSANIVEMYPVWRIAGVCVGGAAAIVALFNWLAGVRPGCGVARRWAGFGVWMAMAIGLTWGAFHAEWQSSPQRVLNELQSNGPDERQRRFVDAGSRLRAVLPDASARRGPLPARASCSIRKEPSGSATAFAPAAHPGR